MYETKQTNERLLACYPHSFTAFLSSQPNYMLYSKNHMKTGKNKPKMTFKNNAYPKLSKLCRSSLREKV